MLLPLIRTALTVTLIALLLTQESVACVIAEEPATVLLFAELDASKERPDYEAIIKRPQDFYTGKFKKTALAMLESINSPFLILHGDVHPLKKINLEILIPELEALGKNVTYQKFPGLNHGFYWVNERSGATQETVDRILADATAYIEQHTILHRTGK